MYRWFLEECEKISATDASCFTWMRAAVIEEHTLRFALKDGFTKVGRFLPSGLFCSGTARGWPFFITLLFSRRL